MAQRRDPSRKRLAIAGVALVTCDLEFVRCESDDKKNDDCGNGQLDPGETCDGGIGDLTCEGLGFEGGELVCDPVYCYLNTERCE